MTQPDMFEQPISELEAEAEAIYYEHYRPLRDQGYPEDHPRVQFQANRFLKNYDALMKRLEEMTPCPKD